MGHTNITTHHITCHSKLPLKLLQCAYKMSLCVTISCQKYNWRFQKRRDGLLTVDKLINIVELKESEKKLGLCQLKKKLKNGSVVDY